MAAKIWQNVRVLMSRPSVFGAAKTITTITKASEGVATATAHGFNTGDYVLLISEEGMWQLNGMIVRIKAAETDSFTLEGVDTTLFDVAEEGKTKARKVTFSVGLSSLTSISASGGDYDYVDTSTIHKSVRTQIPGLPSAARYQFDSIWDPADPALQQLKKANDAQEECALFFQFGVLGPIMVFKGAVGANLLPAGQAHGLITCQVAITLAGAPQYYSS